MRKISWCLLLAVWVQTATAHGPTIGFGDAGLQGTFTMGAAQAALSRGLAGAPVNRELPVVDFRLPDGTTAGAWAKDFPTAVTRGRTDVIDIGVEVSEVPSGAIAAAVEIKGSAGIQRIPVPFHRGWSRVRTLLDWDSIGALNETVLLIARTGGADPAVGRVRFDLGFQSLSLPEKLYATSGGRIGGVLTVSLLLGMLIAVVRRRGTVRITGFARDLAHGVASALIAFSVLGTWALGTASALEFGWVCFLVAGAGALTRVLSTLTLAGRLPSVGEAIDSAFFPGLLAASASDAVVWAAPTSPESFLELSGFGAASFVLALALANAYRLASRKRPLGPIGDAVIVATPFVFGLLLALQSVHTFALRALLVFAFGEFIANGSTLINRNRPLFAPEVHAVLAVLAVLVTAAPDIAALGSGTTAASLPDALRPLVAVIATMFSQGPLWAIVHVLTGLVLGAIRGGIPSGRAARDDAVRGLKQGMVFGGVLMGLLQAVHVLNDWSWVRDFYSAAPMLFFAVSGMAAFPLLKTIVETFDGSHAFFIRAAHAYRDPVLLLRGLMLGLATAYGVGAGFPELSTSTRIGFGAAAGASVFGGVSLVRDLLFGARGTGGVQSWRGYLVECGLGLFIGAAIGFYLDAAQLPIVRTKFELYNSFGLDPTEIVNWCRQLRTTAPNEFYALLSRWGHIKLPDASGGSQILFNEALMGVTGWGIAAPLFAINKAFLSALLNRDAAGVRRLSTRAGVAELADGTVRVLRWGLWMAPPIFTFLRPMADATWYNQDGLVHTGFALVTSLTHDATGFTAWSLTVFSWIIGYGWFQVLIWIDHMGLRVATLVNLSFIGLDRLDERCAAFVGRAATARFIPEGVKRFTTWAPLLIPFYLPAGAQWEQVYIAGSAIKARQAGVYPEFASLVIAALATAALATLAFGMRRKYVLGHRPQRARPLRLVNYGYSVDLKKNGELYSYLRESGLGISRCAFENVDPSGRILFVVETGDDGRPHRAWPVLGNFPRDVFEPSTGEGDGEQIRVVNCANQVRVTLTIRLPEPGDAVETWEAELEDLSGRARKLMLVPYLEWMLNHPDADRNHTQYNRLYPEMSYRSDLNALIAYHRSSRMYGWLASSVPPKGFLTTRVDFIGRAGSIWAPRVLDTLEFRSALDTAACPTFDPIGALLLDTPVPALGRQSCRIQIGCDQVQARAEQLILKHLEPQIDAALRGRNPAPRALEIGHGEIPAGTPDRYFEYSADGNTLRVLTPFTPRPFDHEMANALGYVMAVTNHGLHSSCCGNAQQNRLTPDRADLVGGQIPSEAIYLYDEASGEWFSPCYDPLKDRSATHDVAFSLDGTALFRMLKGDIETELSVHVPVDDPAGIYLLKIRNRGSARRRLRIAPYFQIVLTQNPEQAGPLKIAHSADGGILYFENPRNRFHTGTCFVTMSEPVQTFAVRRGSFFGAGRAVARPVMIETGVPAPAQGDVFPVAALLASVDIPGGAEQVISIVLGEADTRCQAEACATRLRCVETATQSLHATRDWWMALQSTLTVETSDPAFDAYVRWLKYQTLSERIWARKGFYQASGAFGFRDQLQDTVNLIWVDPSLARAQLILHAAQQFPEGDVAHWFFVQQDGRTGFLNRSHASDNLLWLGWGVGEYLRMTGDTSILDERVSYLKAETPLEPLPAGKHGMVFFPLRSPGGDCVYEHVMRAVDLVFEHRIGRNGLPLMGTGDWNDGFDAIGSEGRGESVWMAFFLICVLKNLLPVIGARSGVGRRDHYARKLERLAASIENVWRGDRYLRAIHDDGTEIGVAGAGFWETDAIGAAWAVFAGVDPERSRTALDTALRVLERDKVILLGWPALRADTRPYLGRSSHYPEGVRENGMYSHGVQWLTRACRLVSERLAGQGDEEGAQHYRDAVVRLWYKISAITHARGAEIETYGGQPNQQCADYTTVHDPGRMIWNGYTGAAGWMLRQACESVVGAELMRNEVRLPDDFDQPRGGLTVKRISRDLAGSPFKR